MNIEIKEVTTKEELEEFKKKNLDFFNVDVKEIELPKSIIQQMDDEIEDIKQKMCDHYCKYPNIWDREKEGCELWESRICLECPLMRL